MSSHMLLASALNDDPMAVAIFFLDDNGEVVDSALADGVQYDITATGAYLEIQLRKLRDVALEWDDAPSNFIHFEKGRYQYMAAVLPDGYFLVMVFGRPSVVARGKKVLLETVDSITQEFFTL